MSPSTLSCRSGTGFGRPVVPDVKEIAATSGGEAGASASSGPVASQAPFPGATTTGTSTTRPASSGRVTMAAGRSWATTWASSSGERRGLRGTYTPPANQIPNSAATMSAPLGSITPTAWPGRKPASRSTAASASARPRSSARVTSSVVVYTATVVASLSRGSRTSARLPLTPSPVVVRSRSRLVELQPLRLTLLRERQRTFGLVGVAPHRHQLLRARPAPVGQAVLQRAPQRPLRRAHRRR